MYVYIYVLIVLIKLYLGALNCTFCDGIDNIPSLKLDSVDLHNMVKEGEPFMLHDLPGYYDSTLTFNDIKKLFLQNKDDMDDGICEIKESYKFNLVSDYFKMSEEEVKEQNISISW